MIRTPLSIALGGAFWTPGATVVGGTSKKTFDQLIQSLFANNEQGFVYDPNDLSTMFQNSAGTIPVTAVGQPVGLIRDKSGRNNHTYQSTSASRPILRQNAVTGANYLEFDGSDDFLRTNNIDFTATDKMSLFVGVTKLADSAQLIAELSPSISTNTGSFYLAAVASDGGNGYMSLARGSANINISQAARNFTSSTPDVAVLSVKHDISGDLSSVRGNGVIGINGIGDKGAGKFGTYPLFIGRRGGIEVSFNGHIYGLIGIGKLTSDAETLAIEKELAKRAGVTLSV